MRQEEKALLVAIVREWLDALAKTGARPQEDAA